MGESMTGYGSARKVVGPIEITVAVKSVNGRFFELRSHLPKEYSPQEGQIKKTLAQILRRGSVEIFVQRRWLEAPAVTVRTNLKVAAAWTKALKDLKRATGVSGEVALAQIATLPDVFSAVSQTEVSGKEVKALLPLVKAAALACQKERQREGRQLAEILRQILQDLSGILSQIGTAVKQGRAEQEKRLQERVQGILRGADEPSRVIQEVALALEKTDVHEELSRLGEHLSQCHRLLAAEADVGKKLDFYAQELLREMNTVTSKSISARVTQLGVEGKSAIERFKEQVQNLA